MSDNDFFDEEHALDMVLNHMINSLQEDNMNSLDTQYQDLLKTILDYGITKSDRTGTGTKSIFGYTIRHNMKDGFPLLTTKKMAIKSLMTELKWFLKGDTNIKYLVDNNCNIWNGDAYKRYTNNFLGYEDVPTMEWFVNEIKTNDEFANKWGDLGPVYGKQWKKWDKYDHELIDKNKFPNVKSTVDQIENLIEQLKTNPNSRRLMISAWNVGDIDKMVLPPCHYGFQVYTRPLSYIERYDLWFNNNYETGMEKNYDIEPDFDNDYYQPTPTLGLSLMWNQRSVDTFLGLPFNIASYAMLLTLLSKEVNMVPDQLIGNLGDTHLYLNHIEQAKEQISREPMSLPKVEITNCDIKNGDFEYEIIGYNSHPTIKAPLSN